MSILSIRNVSKRYGDFLLDNVNLELCGGEVLGFIGANGAGKSTLIRLIMELAKKDSGEIDVFGTRGMTSEKKQEIGIVLDEANFPEILTAEAINRILKGAYKNHDSSLFFDFLDRFEISKKKEFKEYSKGMKMKLAICSALAHRPRLIILDEPTGGLDPLVRSDIIDLFYDYINEDRAIFISSHITSDLEKLCDNIAIIGNGKLLLNENKDTLLDDYVIVSAEESDLPSDEKIVGRHTGAVQTRLLLKRCDTPKNAVLARPTLEDIMIFMTKKSERSIEL